MLVKPREFPDLWTPRRSAIREAADGFGPFFNGSYQRKSTGVYCRNAAGVYPRNNATSGASCGCGCKVCANGRTASSLTIVINGNMGFCTCAHVVSVFGWVSGSGPTDGVTIDVPYSAALSNATRCFYQRQIFDISALGFDVREYSDAACTTPRDASFPLGGMLIQAIYTIASRNWNVQMQLYHSDGAALDLTTYGLFFKHSTTIPVPAGGADCANPLNMVNDGTTCTGVVGGGGVTYGAYGGNIDLYQNA